MNGIVLTLLMILRMPLCAGDFHDFRAEVQRKLPAGWICGPIRTLEGDTLFDVDSPKNRFRIALFRHELLSQNELTQRVSRMKRAVDELAAGKELPIEQKRAAAKAIQEGMSLPDGRFAGTAVRVSVAEPELHYPGMEAEARESEVIVKSILSILKLYDKSEPTDADHPAAPPKGNPATKPQPTTREPKDGPR